MAVWRQTTRDRKSSPSWLNRNDCPKPPSDHARCRTVGWGKAKRGHHSDQRTWIDGGHGAIAHPTNLPPNHRPVPLDAGLQHLIHLPAPPVARKNLDFGIAGKSLRLDCGAERFDVDDAIAHHAAIIE